MRKNIISLGSVEWNNIVTRLNAMKASGSYDAFTRRHMDAMMLLTRFPGETNTQRNAAHRGPAFLPWHRKSLLEFEAALGAHLPYWNWEAAGSNWRTSSVWNLIGGNGNGSQGWRVTTGPFANWRSIIYNNGAYVGRQGIIRQWTQGGATNPVPITQAVYDIAPWSENVNPATSFRQQLEVAHNNVHNLIGGDMGAGTSPNDPLFWFHHCNVERIFWRWQARNGFANFPASGAPTGHNSPDNMQGLGAPATINSVLDPRTLGVTYDNLG